MSNNKNLEQNKEIQGELLDKSDSTISSAELATMNAKFEEVRNSMLSEFVSLLQNQIIPSSYIKSRIVTGKIVEINKKQGIVIVDCGLKSEAVVEIREFADSDDESAVESVELNIGDEYEFYIESFETQKNVLSINRRRVKKEKTWQKIREAFKIGDHQFCCKILLYFKLFCIVIKQIFTRRFQVQHKGATLGNLRIFISKMKALNLCNPTLKKLVQKGISPRTRNHMHIMSRLQQMRNHNLTSRSMTHSFAGYSI